MTGRPSELHLRHLLGQQFGTAVVMSKIEIAFHELDGMDVCAVDVLPSMEPLILKTRDKNGQAVEKLFVRVGNMSQELALSEVSAYLAERP